MALASGLPVATLIHAACPQFQVKHPIPTLCGAKQYRLDSKRRVTIPPAWRPEDGAAVFLVPKVTHELPLLSVLSRTSYDNEIGQMIASDPPGKAMKVRLGRWIMLCRELSISQQGKLLIPKDLCERAGLAAESDVMLVGRWDHFEIWNVENFGRAREIESRGRQADDLGGL